MVLYYIVAAAAVLLIATVWIVLSMGIAMCLDPYQPHADPMGSSWGAKLADRWEYSLNQAASFITVRNIVSRHLVLQIVLRIVWLIAGAPVKWALYLPLILLIYSAAGAVALIRGIALRIGYLLLNTEFPDDPDDSEDYAGDWTVIWRIQACGRTPKEAVEEAYNVFRDPGEALTFEVVKGNVEPVQGTEFIDMFNTEDPCGE